MSTRRTSTDLALIAGFAALIAVCALLPAIKVGAEPGADHAADLRRPARGRRARSRRGFLAVLLYVVVGAGGAPGLLRRRRRSGRARRPDRRLPARLPPRRRPLRLPRRAAAPTQDRHQRSADLPRRPRRSALLIHPLGIAGLVLRADLTWSEAFDDRQGASGSATCSRTSPWPWSPPPSTAPSPTCWGAAAPRSSPTGPAAPLREPPRAPRRHRRAARPRRVTSRSSAAPR